MGSASPIRTLAFLDKGRYFENDVHVGAYTLLQVTEQPIGITSSISTNYTVRIDYIEGNRIELLIRINSLAPLELNIDGLSGRGGPSAATKN